MQTYLFPLSCEANKLFITQKHRTKVFISKLDMIEQLL